MKSALILCSGGLDSVTLAHYVKKRLKYNSIKLLFFNYGQRNARSEKKYAKICAKDLGAKFIKVRLKNLDKISPSLLTSNLEANEVALKSLKDTTNESNNWYVPCRNLIFLSYASAIAESLFIKENKEVEIFVGFKNEGKESYPDTTQEFLDNLNKLNKSSTMAKPIISAPLIKKDKEDIVLLGKKIGLNFNKTYSCYVGKRRHCGYCLACRLRQEGFYWANISDPTIYKIKLKDFRLAK